MPDEAGAAGVEGRHQLEHDGIGVDGGGVALDHRAVKGVDARLDEQVRQLKDGVLDARGDARGEHAFGKGGVYAQAGKAQAVGAAGAGERRQDERAGEPLRDGRSQRHPRHRHIADDDEKEVEEDVGDARGRQKQQRFAGIAVGGKDAVAAVVQRRARGARKIDVHIQQRPFQKLRLGAHQQQHGAGKPHRQRRHQQPEGGGYDERRMRRPRGALFVFRPQTLRHDGVDARAHADQKPREQGDVCGGGTDGAQRARRAEPAHHGYV